ncbi:MAG: sel1 repeat family protein [Alphaproteobacteria bacterium]|nr:sel1 repeat family protein [Alphaproteobacteria bacterium]
MSGKIIVIPRLSKLRKLKWLTRSHLFLVILTSSSLLLAGLGSVHGAKEAIDIVFDKGIVIRVMRNQISTNTPSHVKVEGNKDEIHIYTKSTHIGIERSKPFGQLIERLNATSGVKSAILVRFSPDERCANKIENFNQTFLSSLPFPKKIQLLHEIYSSLLKYHKQGSKLAQEKLRPTSQMRLGHSFVKSTKTLSTKEAIVPLRKAVQIFTDAASAGHPTAASNLLSVQHKLACALANSAQGPEEEIPFLREAMNLLTQSAVAGFQQAKETLPLVQSNLAVALANSAQGVMEDIPLLREAVDLLTQSTNSGCQIAKRNLPIEQYKLGVVLANSARYSADKISLLKESIHFLTESVNAGDPYAKKNLPIAQYKLGCILANSAEESAEGITFLRESMELLAQSLFGGYQRAKKKLSAVKYKLGIALANSTQGSVDEISLLREAMYLLKKNTSSGFQDTEKQIVLEQLTQRLASLDAGVI